MIFTTDLDRTLIFSKRRFDPEKIKTVAVEQREGVDCAFMTPRAYECFQKVREKTIFIANTMRGIEQAKRICFIKDNSCDYVVAQNGLYLFRKGEADDTYSELIKRLSSQTAVSFDDAIITVQKELKGIECMSKRYEYMAVFFVDLSLWEPALYIELRSRFEKQGWELYIQGKKLYLSPKAVDKGVALHFIQEREQDGDTIGFGDSYFDIPMLKACETGYSLKDSELESIHPDFFIHYSKAPGILGSEEILADIQNYIEQEMNR